MAATERPPATTRRLPTWRLGIPVALVVLATSITAEAAPLAGAQQAPSAANDTAFKSGLEQYTRGNHTGAIATWETLLTTIGETTGFKVLYNLGLAYQRIGDVTKAIERYRAFVGQVEQRPYVEPDLAARASDARSRAAQLEAAHGQVHVRPPRSGPLVLTRVNGGEPRAAGYTVWLAPGVHTVELFVGTDRSRVVNIEVTKAGEVEVETTPPGTTPETGPTTAPDPTTPSSPPSAPRERAPGEPRSKTWFWIGAGATALSTALPIALHTLASGRADDARALGVGHSGYDAARSDYDDSRTLYYASWALPVTLAVVTTVLWFVSEGRTSSPSPSARRAGLARRTE
jgi:hypothetical protein